MYKKRKLLLLPQDSNPSIIIIAGPNGAGKSTSSHTILFELLNKEVKAFDWDLEFQNFWAKFDFDPAVLDGIRQATNTKFLNHLDTAYKNKTDVAFETNFHDASSIISYLKEARSHNFKCILGFLFMENVPLCTQRVENRVKINRGHDVSQQTITERYYKGLENLEKLLNEFDSIYIYDASKEWQNELIISINQGKIVEIDQTFKTDRLSAVPSLQKLCKKYKSKGKSL